MKRLLQITSLVFICIGSCTTVFCQPFAAALTGIQQNDDLFSSDDILQITLSGNIRDLINDRSNNPKYRSIQLSYKTADGGGQALRTMVKTRGHFRKLKQNCNYPPLSIHFQKSDTLAASLFKYQTKIKLVMPCQGDEFVLREWLAYKIYNLVTPKSFRARLVNIQLNDTKNKKPSAPFYGILLEEELQMAKRNNSLPVTRKIQPYQAKAQEFLNMAVFQYLIGNTDWSVEYLQNIKLLAPDSLSVPIAVPYDFDHSGLVSAPYAKPFELLEMNSVRDRRYRGYCIKDMGDFAASVFLFNGLKDNIYRLVNDCTLLESNYKKSTLRYFDDFYEIINNPKRLQNEFGYPCDKKGTGNVVIKGLRED